MMPMTGDIHLKQHILVCSLSLPKGNIAGHERDQACFRPLASSEEEMTLRGNTALKSKAGSSLGEMQKDTSPKAQLLPLVIYLCLKLIESHFCMCLKILIMKS